MICAAQKFFVLGFFRRVIIAACGTRADFLISPSLLYCFSCASNQDFTRLISTLPSLRPLYEEWSKIDRLRYISNSGMV